MRDTSTIVDAELDEMEDEFHQHYVSAIVATLSCVAMVLLSLLCFGWKYYAEGLMMAIMGLICAMLLIWQRHRIAELDEDYTDLLLDNYNTKEIKRVLLDNYDD